MLTTLALTAALLLQTPALDPAAVRALEDVRVLSADDMEGRAPGTPGSQKARTYIEGRFREIGVVPAGDNGGFEQAFTIRARGQMVAGVNILARIEGTDPAARTLVVTAHYDHEGVRNGQIYNGADDNASGVAGLLAVAQAFKREAPKNTILLAVVDGEELGLHGSRYLIEHMPGGLDKVVLDVNFDMLSKNSRNELFVAGATQHPYLRPRLEAMARVAPLKLMIGHDTAQPSQHDDWTNQSDQYVFHQKNVPWLYFGVEDHPEYHTPRDDFETIPQPFFAASVATVVMAVRMLDGDLAAIAREAGR